jgi:adenylyltransferase/sulfurtransferase
MSIIDAPLELSVEEAKHLLDTRPAQTLLVDVREPHELAICRLPFAEHIPMRQITGQASALARDRHILVLCHHGGRRLLRTRAHSKRYAGRVHHVPGDQ